MKILQPFSSQVQNQNDIDVFQAVSMRPFVNPSHAKNADP